MALNLDHLNPKQREAVLHGIGPLLILAGAGSGKTNTMAHRIAHLIADRHIAPTDVLGLSFTNKAAAELKERVHKIASRAAGPRSTRGLTVSTFHSLCVRILRAQAKHLGFQENFTILDQSDQTDLLRQILRNIKVDDRKFDPGLLLFEMGQAKNRFLSGEAAKNFFLEGGRMSSDYGIVAASVYDKYQDQLRALNAMDFDDLIFHAVRLLENHDEVRNHYNYRFRHILVDEYQDTNPAQFRLLRALTERQQNLCVVGDDDQSIYSWRGADPKHILEFSKQFAGARMITLDQNYRSTNTILKAANQVISANRHRHPKSLWSDKGEGEPLQMIIVEEDRAEAERVAEEILKRARIVVSGVPTQTRPWKDFAVLYRSNPQSRLFEEALRRNNVPYKIVGSMSFLDRKEVKDTLSYWRLIVNPKDDTSARRVLNWPPRGIGKTSFDAIGTHAVANGISFYEALFQVKDLAPKAAAAVASFRDLVERLRADLLATPMEAAPLADWGKRSLERIGVRKALQDECDDPLQADRKFENVDELCNSLGQMKTEAEHTDASGIVTEYLANLTLAANEEEKDDKGAEKDEVTLLTLHGAKGMEYPIVFLVGMEDGLLPHRRSIDEGQDLSEERRLCYVGITRAKEYLIMTRTKNRIRYGKPVPRYPSRFLQEIPAELVLTIDDSYSPDLSSVEARDAHENKVKDFLASIRAQISKT